MQGGGARVCLLCLFAILLTALYPALFLGYRAGPEASLKSAPPWRELSGPLPKPSAEAVDAATHLGPRLASVARSPLGVALWNPWIGGGRAGWLASPEEGGAPLVVLSAVAAKPGWAWTGLLALELTVAWLAAWWALRLLGLGPWAAATGATAYAFSGAVTGHLLDWQGSAFALGPLALAAVLASPASWARRVAAWAATLVALAASGAPAMQFVALAAAAAVVVPGERGRRSWAAALLAAVLTLAAGLPRIWLASHAGEAGATRPTPQVAPAPALWATVLVRQAALDDGPTRPGTDGLAYVGLGTVALGALGLLTAPARRRGFWLGVGVVAAAAVAAPGGWLLRAGLSQRPYGVLALAAATLAAYGTQFLADRLGATRAAGAAVGTVWLLLSLALFSNAARHLPFVPAEETVLATPVDGAAGAPPWRILGLVGTMPPDSSALLPLADVRAASFPDEPAYAALVGGGYGGEVPLSRALDPRMARLGAKWLLEPLPLRVVSGEVFSRIEQVELQPLRGQDGPSVRLAAVVPPGATRVGVQSGVTALRVRLESDDRGTDLDPDQTLQSESTAWSWFAVPPHFPIGPATLILSPLPGRPAADVPVAWDTSGLVPVGERRGARVWERTDARAFAFLARRLQCEPASNDPDVVTVPAERLPALRPLTAGAGGSVEAERQTPGDVVVRTRVPAPALVVVQVKYRPAIWRARVNGARVATEKADGVWTAVAVPVGDARVELRAQLPWAVWSASAAAVAAIMLLATLRRRS